MELGDRSYDITVGRGILGKAKELFQLERTALVVTDSGVPEIYAKTVAKEAKSAEIITVPMGEGSKSLSTLELLLTKMTEMGMTRGDCVIAVGGGVVGDLAGFAASVYMRGIDFYNIPTTLLSQVDSSIGGKTAVNLSGFKNIVGSFHQPKGVLIDLDTLDTLSKRQLYSGLAEAIKMAVCSDKELFELIERTPKDGLSSVLEEIVVASLKIKKKIVEEDERESGSRRLLNLGHTLGHGIESRASDYLYHGECVSLGMMPMLSPEIRDRVAAVLVKFDLPIINDDDNPELDVEAALHDKKATAKGVCAVFVDEIGFGYLKEITHEELRNRALSYWKR